MPAAPACPSITHLQDYLRGQLAPPDADAYRRHLSECPYCQAAASFASSPSLETFALPDDATHVVDDTDATVTQTPARPSHDRAEPATVRTQSIADDDWEPLPDVPPPDGDSGEWAELPTQSDSPSESSAPTDHIDGTVAQTGPLSEHTAWVPSETADPYATRLDPVAAREDNGPPAETQRPTATVAQTAGDGSEDRTRLQTKDSADSATVPVVSGKFARIKVPGYEVVSELGRGGMGVVYKARQVKLGRMVALKMILSGGHASADDLKRFRTEAESIARLQHPNIVQIYEIGDQDGLPYFSLEYCAGGNLSGKLKGTPLTPAQAAATAETLARAVHAAHRAGVVHRDLKPANVLLTADETAKITDFGLAKQTDSQHGQTQSGSILGTPSYMAPEQATGKVSLMGPCTDVWALGAMLYEFLTGRPPFKGTTPLDTVILVTEQEPVAPRLLNPKVPRDLETITLKCLQKDPARRYPSAEALADDLKRFQHGEPILARPVGRVERGLKWARRRPAAAALLALTVLLTAGAVAAGVWYETNQTNMALAAAKELEKARDKVQERLKDGQVFFARGQLAEAEGAFAEAVTRAMTRDELADLRAEAEQDRELVRHQVATQEHQRQAAAKLARFEALRDEAMFHATRSTGLDLAADVKATRAAARDALALFGNGPPDTEGDWKFDVPAADYGEAERTRTRGQAYVLALALAEAAAYPLPGEDARTQAGQALKLLDRVAGLAPPTRAWHLRRADTLDQAGDAAGARAERDRAAAVEPRGVVDDFLLGQERARKRELAAALSYYRQALREDPNLFWVHYALAIAAQSAGLHREALDHLTICQDRKRDFVWTYVVRGFVYGQLGAQAKAAQRADDSARQFANADADFAEAERLSKDDDSKYVLLVNRGVVRILAGRHADALADLTAATARKPDQFTAYLNLAEAYRDRNGPGDLDAAVAPLSKAVELQPALADLYRSRADLHERRGDVAAALADHATAVRLTENAGDSDADRRSAAAARAAEGLLLFRTGRDDEAAALFEAAAKLWPELPAVHRGRGGLALKARQFVEAVQAFDRCLELQRDKPATEVLEARALARAGLGDFAGAVADYGRALDLDPGSGRLFALRGRLYLSLDAPRLALGDLDRAVEHSGADAETYADRAFARARLGQADEARADVEEAQKRDPGREPRLLYKLARAQVVIAAARAAGSSSADARRQRSQAHEQAARWLAEAVEKMPEAERGKFWRDSVTADPFLAPLRPTPEYAREAAKYAQ